MVPLKVEVMYFYPRDNAKKHHTERYEVVNEPESTTAIVRRGEPFNGAVRFDRMYEESTDVIQLCFKIGGESDPQALVTLQRDVTTDKDQWTGRIVDVMPDKTVMIEVSTPVAVPVGAWSVDVITNSRSEPGQEVYEDPNVVYVLFNPWNPDDQVYMGDTALLQEYIQNDVGKIWVGPMRSTRGKPWLFGQFDNVVLPACSKVLDFAQLPYADRGDPIKMTRAISRIVNSNDDDGVLIGRWDGQYEDGTAPYQWTGSVDILQQFFDTDASVAYGQCWVFAGVVTTICRALGIPSRVVSNLVSAHDTNGSLSLDKFYSEHMEELEGNPNDPNAPADSIWNYHVWNDVWMARPDLPSGFGGWQAIDSTPQEQSEGFYQCGPASVEAIKQGVTSVPYDVQFMLSSVNADLFRWKIDSSSETGISVVDTNNYHIGRMILTKKPYVFDPNGDGDRADITLEYKHREGSDSERLALMNGVRKSPKAIEYYAVLENLTRDVTFKIREIDTVFIGEDFRVAVDIQNQSDEGRHIKAMLSAESMYYNGVKAGVVKKQEGRLFVGAGKTEQISIQVKAEDYLPKLVEYCNMKICAMATVEETRHSWADDDDFQIIKPNITIKFGEDLVINQPCDAHLSFTNPLPRALTQCEFRLNSSGIQGRAFRFQVDDVEPKGVVSTVLPVYPNKLGGISLVATFKSAELNDVVGAANVEVFEP